MGERLLSWLRKREGERPFGAFQIEVTSRCNLQCVMCPVAVLADRWPAFDLPWETFQRTAAAFEKTKWVYLQGWGEPLLHPRLFDMIALAKGAGCQVGFTTNGTRLTLAAGERLLDPDLDLLSVSIAGATAATHEAIRGGSDFQRLVDNVRRFLALRTERKRTAPRVELAFLMTRTNLAELPGAVGLAAGLGVDELYATDLDYVVTPELAPLAAFAWSPPPAAFRRAVDEAEALARRAGLRFRPSLLEPREMAVCELNPLRMLFVSSDGWVSPCVYTGVTGQHEIPRVFDGAPLRIQPLRFGNVNERELMETWQTPAYRAFRRQFAERLTRAASLAFSAVGGRVASEEEPPAPEPCRTCPKLWGL